MHCGKVNRYNPMKVDAIVSHLILSPVTAIQILPIAVQFYCLRTFDDNYTTPNPQYHVENTDQGAVAPTLVVPENWRGILKLT